MTGDFDRPWFTQFLVQREDRSESEIVWSDTVGVPVVVREPTLAEKVSILLVGLFAMGWIVLMVVTLIVAVYISRR